MLAAAAAAQPPPGPPSDSGGSLFGSAPSSAKSVVSLRAQFTAPSDGKPGYLFITATIEPGWHIYSITQAAGGPIATKIEASPPPGVSIAGAFQPSVPPEKKKEPEAFGDLPIETHQGTVTWYAPIDVMVGLDPAKLEIRGKVTVQPCDANACLPPTQIPFTAALGAGVALPLPSAAATTGQPAKEPAKTTFDPSKLRIAENDLIRQTPMAIVIATGFLGGLILNLMPCVLPVIGLKLLSFLEQSGHSRQHAFALNVWYSLGMLSVFLVLATLAVTLGFGWGQLFSYTGFNVTLAAVVFTMGLSFLGVWEIPIPGFVGRGKTLELAEKEGAAGAFSKGILTTILATPCSAPFLASALTWAVNQPPPKTYAVFTAVGLGMASPYLLIGAFPSLIAFLPKPGAWMDTFKQIMGFVLLGTVVFLLTFIPIALVVPTVGFLFGLWGACWWIGGTSPTADAGVKVRAWLAAAAFAGAMWFLTFGWLAGVMQGYFDRAVEEAIALQMIEGQVEGGAVVATVKPMLTKNGNRLPWQPFTRPVLEDAIASGATVLVDFTADWCLTCKTLEATVLSTIDVREVAKANGVITLRADWTHGQPEVTRMLELLGSKQVPVLAIFPAGNPNQPIVLRGGYTQQTLLDALRKAGPSKQK
jgi:suppressor for copper-sensitivity B